MDRILRRHAAALTLPGLFLFLAACATGQAPQANCFSFMEPAPQLTLSTKGSEDSRTAEPCSFTAIGGTN